MFEFISDCGIKISFFYYNTPGEGYLECWQYFTLSKYVVGHFDMGQRGIFILYLTLEDKKNNFLCWCLWRSTKQLRCVYVCMCYDVYVYVNVFNVCKQAGTSTTLRNLSQINDHFKFGHYLEIYRKNIYYIN